METIERWKHLSQALYKTDPMHTCCKENDCFDEYDGIAGALDKLLGEGVALQSAIRRVFAEYFGEELAASMSLELAERALREALA